MSNLENDSSATATDNTVESRGDSGTHAVNEVYGNAGDKSTLDSFRQTNNSNGADSLPPMELTAGDGKADSSSSATNKSQLEQGVVQLDTSDPGRRDNSDCTGFLVNKEGTSDLPKDDTRLIGTAAHCITDRQGDQYKLDKNLFGKNGTDSLSKEDLSKRGDAIVKKQDPTKPGLIYASEQDKAKHELDHLKQNYDGIKSVSKEKDPSAKGITSEGLKEFRQRQTTTTVDTAAGKFKAEPVAIDKDNDVAVIKIKGLSPEQQQKLGPNQKFGTEPLQMNDKTYSIGQGKIKEGHIDGLDRFEHLGDKNDSIIIDRGLDHGMSGGPTRDEKGDVVGVNHAGSAKWGAVTPITDLKKVLNRPEVRR